MEKKRDCMGISSEKLAKYHKRKPGHGYEIIKNVNPLFSNREVVINIAIKR